ncbi:bifunctional phosphoribosyl-AMP cyclohydrolase/phosphoribosyl-ATP diphosphatase HisIE [Buchnera aphidicola]|uniref:Histidine biosynthesis bifunctional protein HisIE n=1 Tax=Buchnera aphidicola (Sarucallis kahawaluokalani) TaxID=1241878 RepID=A0A4D6Y9M1_9GAMM|nr:bifunctional phosphoribosyl-AMP cyclohydrolase/phosphoribosyl-ATP diphosphatase HisIE [Buchnera aphidicola]QCI25882.1 bifunctional phosphoribosyl-AMP cyclohydrolase/phosphoribosyl-ATP diphosphatase HisIE [Buchnera aphidicola (Sarucallis kahawaluokalani)]
MLNDKQLLNINWKKVHGLIPCIIQNFLSSEILMHGYMNQNALHLTLKNKLVTFYSRTKKKLWTKGETSGNFLKVIDMILDCDQDSILILVDAVGPTCHLKNISCFHGIKTDYTNFFYLEKIIQSRINTSIQTSYTAKLHNEGINRIAQKVGEEAIEIVIAAINNNELDIINEASDLIYHLLVLLHQRNLNFKNIINNLKVRNKIK